MKNLLWIGVGIIIAWSFNLAIAQQDGFMQTRIPVACATTEFAIDQQRYLQRSPNQVIVAAWNDPQSNAYGIMLYYVEENGVEIVLLDPARKNFCLVTGGELRPSVAFPGLVDLLRSQGI